MKEIAHKQKTLLILLSIAVVLSGVLLATNRSKFYYKASTNPVIFSVVAVGGSNYQVGSTVQVDVNIDTGGNNVVSTEVIMTYPSSLLQLQSDSKGGSSWNAYGDGGSSTGTIDRLIGSASDTGVNGVATLFTMQFKVLAVGSGSFTITEGDAALPSTQTLPTTLNGATFTSYDQPVTPIAILPHPTTYKSTYTLNGTKSSGIATILVNGTSSNVTVNNIANTWTATNISLSIGSNSITLVGQDGGGNSSLAGTVTLPRYKSADANNDNKVDVSDFAKLVVTWNKDVNTGDNYLADFNEDDSVDVSDFAALLGSWKK